MRKSLFMVAIFVLSTLSPMAAGDVTETQFKDGSTSYTHVFSGTGNGTAGELTFPYGAEVTSTAFEIEGKPSTTSWGNMSNNSNFGGEGTSTWTGTPPGFAYGYKNNVEMVNDQVKLPGNPTTDKNGLSNSNDLSVSSAGTTHNTTGAFVSTGDHSFIGASEDLTAKTLTGSSNSYTGAMVEQYGEYHVLTYTSSSISQTPTIKRYNTSTGAYKGTTSVSYGTCPTLSLYYTQDATTGGDGTVWTVSERYRYVIEWSVSTTTSSSGTTSSSWSCQNYYTMSSTYYVSGIDIDEDSGRMFLLMYQSSYPDYNRYLFEVNPSSPNLINGSWLLGNRVSMGDTSTYPSGLYVDLPRITTNEYRYSMGYRDYFTFSGMFVEKMGKESFSHGGHYGLESLGDGTLGYTCHYTTSSYCSGYSNKVNRVGSGTPTDERTPSSTSVSVTSKTRSISKSITDITLTSAVGYIPDNTSIELMLSNDGGVSWLPAVVGQTVTFLNGGQSIKWSAYLNGTSTESPILDFVSLTYSTTYQTSGYFYIRSNYYSGNAPVASTVWWNSSTPAGTSLAIELQAGTTSTFANSGDSKSVTMTSGYLYFYIRFTSTGSSTPVLDDINIALHSDAPSNVGLQIDGTEKWQSQGVLLGETTVGGVAIVKAFNDLIPQTGSGTVNISVGLSAQSSGVVVLKSFSVTYKIKTVNLDITIPTGEILHERSEPYEVVTRHIIGDGTNNYITEAKLSFGASPASSAPTLEWQYGDIFPSPNDPDDWIELDSSSWSSESNGILEIHWKFFVTSNFPDQDNVRFTTRCTDNTGVDGDSPTPLTSAEGLRVNNSFGLGWLKIRDNYGEVTSDDVESGSWVAAGETLLFQGAMWFADSQDAPKDNAFDIRVAQNGFVHSNWRDTTNMNGSFFVSIDMPNIDVEEGLTYEIQTYNERDATKVLPSNSDWTRTYKIDATHPEVLSTSPLEEAYEAADSQQKVKIKVADSVGDPLSLTLFYWVEADHDSNRNGEADPSEYASKIVTNETEADEKWFITTIDHSRNPNMGRVSYYWDGGDRAGNPLHYSTLIDEMEYISESGPGFDSDDATFRSRKDSSAIFTGLTWEGHNDGGSIYAGTPQTISLGLIDANTAIDFEYINVVFDFEGPNSEVDRQTVTYYGITDMFDTKSDFITLAQSSQMVQTTNESGMPLILIDFDFTFGWDWPDEDISDISLEYKERGEEFPTRHIIAEHTFVVENDLVLDASTFMIEDISEPRTGIIADGSRVRNDDRLEFSGRVVYEGSKVPAPRDASIVIEVFDGEKIWSDGSLTEDGGYSVEVPLSSAETLRSSPTRTCLISIGGIPGSGEDMTGQTVSTTLQVIVDDTAPRVVSRSEPVNVIDISDLTDLTNIPVTFQGTEDADMTGSEQFVHWVMRDSSRTLTLGAGQARLGMQQSGQMVNWTGTVDLTDNGRITPREGDWVGFYLTGYDAAGNEFPLVSNSEASPIPEIAEIDDDFERQWIRLGAVGPELKITSIRLSDDHIAPGQTIQITADIYNSGGTSPSQFKISFYKGDDIVPFDSATLNSIGEGEIIPVTASWTAEEGVDRIRVTVDPDDVIVEVNNDDNTAEHKIEIVYVSYMGWFDSVREQPLIWIFSILSILVLIAVGVTANRTAITHGDDDYYIEEEWDGDEEYDDEDDDGYDDEY